MRLAPAVVAPTEAADADDISEHHLLGFDLWSVLRFSTLFYLWVLAVLVIGVSITVIAVTTMGVVADFERFMRGIGFTHFQILSEQLFVGLALIAVVWFIAMLIVTVTAAALYNLLARWFGGVTVIVGNPADDHQAEIPVPGEIALEVVINEPKAVDATPGEVDGEASIADEEPEVPVVSWRAPELITSHRALDFRRAGAGFTATPSHR